VKFKPISSKEVAAGGLVWRLNTLRFSSVGSTSRVALDGKLYIDTDDSHISGASAVGVRTKFDA
jgi:hypothetical protein